MEVGQLRGSQGFWQHQVLRGVGDYSSRKYSALEGHTVLANTLQYSCLENPLTDRESWQATVYRVEKSRTLLKQLCTQRPKTLFSCVSPSPVRVEHEVGTAAWLAGTLAAPSVQGLRLPPPQELWPYQSLFPASCSWRSGGPFG